MLSYQIKPWCNVLSSILVAVRPSTSTCAAASEVQLQRWCTMRNSCCCVQLQWFLIFFLKAWKSNWKINKTNLLPVWFTDRVINYRLLCLAITRREVLLHVLWRKEFSGQPQMKPKQTGMNGVQPSGCASSPSDMEQHRSGSCTAVFVWDAVREGLLLVAIR